MLLVRVGKARLLSDMLMPEEDSVEKNGANNPQHLNVHSVVAVGISNLYRIFIS